MIPLTNQTTPKRLIVCQPDTTRQVELLEARMDLTVVRWVLSGRPDVEEFLRYE